MICILYVVLLVGLAGLAVVIWMAVVKIGGDAIYRRIKNEEIARLKAWGCEAEAEHGASEFLRSTLVEALRWRCRSGGAQTRWLKVD